MTPARRTPHLADATDLERWANRVDARYQFAHLLRRLIRKENGQVVRVEMRTGEGAGMPGYDGDVVAMRGTPFVPEGHSVWEMGVGVDPAAKANADYRTRTDEPLGVVPAETTFVFVTPRRWDKKSDWAARKREEGHWKDAVALDADDVEQALDECRAVHVWFSERLGMTPTEVQTLEDWWARFSSLYKPELTVGLVLAGRADQAAELLRQLQRDVGPTYVRAASMDDGIAFVSAAMMAADGDEPGELVARSLLVYDGANLRHLDATASLLILLPYTEELRREAEMVSNHHVVCIVTEGGGAAIELPPLDHNAVEAELRELGVEQSELTELVRAAARSLLALRRVSSGTGLGPSEWGDGLASSEVRRAWLVGAWNSRRAGDVEVLSSTIGTAYADAQDAIVQASRGPDPLFVNIGSSWKVADLKASWPYARFAITTSDLEALAGAVQVVLGAVDPRLELPVEQRWTAELHGTARDHSSEQRTGISRTLALLGSSGDELRSGAAGSAKTWTDGVTSLLFSRANDDVTGRLWASLADQLPLLVEASPDVALRALDEAATGSAPLLTVLFQDGVDAFGVTSPHTGVLWALECAAWSPMYMGLAAELLARLTELDPGGRLSNRPSNSLHKLFMPWMPQTVAPFEQRSATLDALMRRHPDASWHLLLSLLPQGSEVVMPSHTPEFRDWAATAPVEVSRADFVAGVEDVARRVLDVVDHDASRWSAVVPALDRFPPAALERAIAALEALAADVTTSSAGNELWTAITTFVRRHRQFPDAHWSMQEEVLARLDEVARHLTPSLASDSDRWLFDSWHPDLGPRRDDDFENFDREVREARAETIARVLAQEGLDGVLSMASGVELPGSVGAALADVTGQYDSDLIPLIDSDVKPLRDLATSYAGARAQADGGWARSWAERMVGSPTVQARLLLVHTDIEESWATMAELGPEVESAYWREFHPYGRGGDFPQVQRAARALMTEGRPAMAIDALSLYADRLGDELDPELTIEVLTALASSPDPQRSVVSEHDVVRLMGALRRAGVDNSRIAVLEWIYFPLLGRTGEALSLQRELATSPRLFVDLVSAVFRPASERGEPREDSSDAVPGLAANAYRLLREWRTVPGSSPSGEVDQRGLTEWLEESRRLLAEADRSEVGELQMGEVLAHSPTDADGIFPCIAVREALETAPDDRLERGFIVGVFNKRGVTSRGLTEGGAQEYALAARYSGWAEQLQARYPRTAVALRLIADQYRDEGRRNDEEARRFVEGLDR